MNGLMFDLEPCCGDWVQVCRWKPVEFIAKTVVECDGCGKRNVVTVTCRPARSDEVTRRHLEAV